MWIIVVLTDDLVLRAACLLFIRLCTTMPLLGIVWLSLLRVIIGAEFLNEALREIHHLGEGIITI